MMAMKGHMERRIKAKTMTLSLSLSLFFVLFCVVVGGEFHAWKQKIKKGRKDRQHVYSNEDPSVLN